MAPASVIDATTAEGVPVARYYALYSLLRRGIREGEYLPGMRLPTVTELVNRYRVSRTTVARALEELERAGLVEARWGAGVFVTPEAIPAIEVLIAGGRPRPGRARAVFLDHLLEAVREGFGEPARRVTMNYTLEGVPSADEIVAVARARRAECILAYRPDGPLCAELARVSERVPVISLFHEIPDSCADAVLFDARDVVEKVVAGLVAAGRRRFVYVACRPLEADADASPYVALHDAFKSAMARVGIEPMICHLESVDISTPGDSALVERLHALPADGVVFGDTLGRANVPGEKYQFTESPETCQTLRARGINVLYMDFRRACRAAADLATRRRGSDAGSPGRVLRVAPEVVPADSEAVPAGTMKESVS